MGILAKLIVVTRVLLLIGHVILSFSLDSNIYLFLFGWAPFLSAGLVIWASFLPLRCSGRLTTSFLRQLQNNKGIFQSSLNWSFISVLRKHLICMQIQILDPGWKKMDPDPSYLFKIYYFFLTKQSFLNVLFLSLIYMLKLNEPFS